MHVEHQARRTKRTIKGKLKGEPEGKDPIRMDITGTGEEG